MSASGHARRGDGTGLSPRQQASLAQFRAADPKTSVFVAASAGSGKTKLLTDRLQRLLIAGVDPQRLLCLTYTKAAAAEMGTRLNRVLGEWAIAPAEALEAELGRLLGRPPHQEERARARRLFAQVLDLPGGMRISTLHAFAQSLLRGFPLEAGLMPGFSLFEEADERAALAEAREEVLPAHPAMPLLATLAGERELAALTEDLVAHRQRLAEARQRAGGDRGLLAAIGRALGVAEGASPASLRQARTQPGNETELARASALLKNSGHAGDRDRGVAMGEWLALAEPERQAGFDLWERLFLTGKGTARADKFLATKEGLGTNQGALLDILRAEAARLEALRGQASALALFEATGAALAAGQAVLDRLARMKRETGRQSYDDLIQGASGLLDDPGAAWVLFKLDGGLDHVLVDEAQDSNAAQWRIVQRITDEFFAGEGQAEASRTIFAVGDLKQSIFSFQGADAAGLPRACQHFEAAARDAGAPFDEVPLDVSFRSAPAVLQLVDAVFAEGPAREGVLQGSERLHHRPSREHAAGRVEFWPLQTEEEKAEAPEWTVPEEPVAEQGPEARLARALARRIRHMIDHERLEARHEGDPAIPRRVRAGDILVLLRKRDAFAGLLIRELKQLNVPVGGLDRIHLVQNIAVRDVLATLDAVLLPEDDLQLAAALKSPIFGLDDGQLFGLCYGRAGRLFAELEQRRGADTPEGRAADLLAALTARADHVPPYALIAELLGERGARARLLARLGPDAADPLDELLNAALAHERAHPPSLQGFLHWLRRANTEIKRETDRAGGVVRLMTVHGAKGLQAPIVILPHTIGEPPRPGGLRWTPEGLPLWAPRKDGFEAPALAGADAARREAERQEDHRLLYVALTRAEDRLLICGFFRKRQAEESWYELIRSGLRRLGAAEQGFAPEYFGADRGGFQAEPMLVWRNAQAGPREADRRIEADAPEPPPLTAPDPLRMAEAMPRLLTPSRDAEADVPPAAPHLPADPLGRRFRRGNLVHALLQTLPEMEPARRADAALRFLARPGHGLDLAERTALLEEVLSVLQMPELTAAFGPGSLAEAPIAARFGDGQMVIGVVDRLLVEPRQVLVLDYKTNRPPPSRVEETPPAYLRQMALYRHALRLAFPGRPVRCALVWTYAARAVLLPDGLLDTHAPAGVA